MANKKKSSTKNTHKQSATAGRKRVSFQLLAEPGSEVSLAGSFNNWNGESRKMKDTDGSGKYSITLMLAPGEYQYKFRVNGDWIADPECPGWVTNDFGTLNSVLTV